jgi:hypothetical protein
MRIALVFVLAPLAATSLALWIVPTFATDNVEHHHPAQHRHHPAKATGVSSSSTETPRDETRWSY